MRKLPVLAAAAVLSLTASAAAWAADPPGHHGGPPHAGRSPHVGISPRTGGPGMPPRGFHRAPPNFQGPRSRGIAPSAPHYQMGPGRDLGLFDGRRFPQLRWSDRNRWAGGSWRHEQHDGHLGWWWVVGGAWFFYPAPIYPYPTYIGPNYYYNYDDYYQSPTNYWYYCEDPPGYYPDVQNCSVPWEPVPPQ